MRIKSSSFKNFLVFLVLSLYGCFGDGDDQKDLDDIISNEENSDLQSSNQVNPEAPLNENLELDENSDMDMDMDMGIENDLANEEKLNTQSQNLDSIQEAPVANLNNENNFGDINQELSLANEANPFQDLTQENEVTLDDKNNSFAPQEIDNTQQQEINLSISDKNSPSETSLYYLVKDTFSYKDTSAQIQNARYSKGDTVLISTIENNWAKVDENNYLSLNDLSKEAVARERGHNPFQ